MSFFHINIDMAELGEITGLKELLTGMSKEAGQKLATAIHAHGVELASQRLKTRRQLFIDHWTFHPESDGVWLIQLEGKVRWIDDGFPQHNMLDDLLKSPKAKYVKKGKKKGMKYVIVPFDHSPGKGKTGSTPAQMDLTKTIQKEIKKLNIPWSKLENGPDGKPKLGLLHKLNIMHAPLKTGDGVGQGWGPTGEVKQGPNERQKVGGGPGGGGHPFLQGLNIYQSAEVDKKGQPFTKRTFMTFRIATDEHRSQGRWDHPGLKPVNIVEDTLMWAMDQWQAKLEPAMLELVLSKL